MVRVDDFGAVSAASITVVIDNYADLFMRSTETVRRFTKRPLLAEHGFSALVDLGGTTILWDAGLTRAAFVENLARLEVDLRRVDVIALSHGHRDHTAGILDAVKAICPRPEERRWEAGASVEPMIECAQERHVPLVAHPAAFRERWRIEAGGVRRGPGMPPPRAEWEAAGAELVLTEAPHRLAPGCWTTGYVPRRSFEKTQFFPERLYRDGREFKPDAVEDDQAIVIHVEGKGLVVLAGCAHAGVVNTVECAREISGIDRVWAILGGFHLVPAGDDDIRRTVEAIQALNPALVVPTHCTGLRAIGEFGRRMPDQFVAGTVGATYAF
jgi:7,8-dihydropterin-6-yl-methyl-4-(beta-D-ribofuranosyl)aminobenzene 5'-phosphate synthase